MHKTTLKRWEKTAMGFDLRAIKDPNFHVPPSITTANRAHSQMLEAYQKVAEGYLYQLCGEEEWGYNVKVEYSEADIYVDGNGKKRHYGGYFYFTIKRNMSFYAEDHFEEKPDRFNRKHFNLKISEEHIAFYDTEQLQRFIEKAYHSLKRFELINKNAKAELTKMLELEKR